MLNSFVIWLQDTSQSNCSWGSCMSRSSFVTHYFQQCLLLSFLCTSSVLLWNAILMPPHGYISASIQGPTHWLCLFYESFFGYAHQTQPLAMSPISHYSFHMTYVSFLLVQINLVFSVCLLKTQITDHAFISIFCQDLTLFLVQSMHFSFIC